MKSQIDKLVFILITVIIFTTNGCHGTSDKSNNPSEQNIPEYSYYFLQFLDGNDKLLFLRYDQRNSKTKSIFIYEIQSHRLYLPLIMNSLDYPRTPRFSHDKKQVVFVSDKDGGRNIYMMKAEGSGVRQLTFSKGNNKTDSEGNFDVETNEGPSFSPDGKRIIFKRAHTLRVRKYSSGYSVGPIWWDVFEIEIATGQERRLTYIDSHLMSDPFYLSDGKRFVFQGSKRIEDEGIYIADNESGSLNKISAGGWWIPGPRISRNDKIVFMGGKHLQHPDHDLFIYENGKIKRLNWIQRGSYVTNLAISPDGSKILFEIGKYDKPYMIEQSLWIGKADGTELQEIKIPWESLKENK